MIITRYCYYCGKKMITETKTPLGWFHYCGVDCNNAHKKEVLKRNVKLRKEESIKDRWK